MGFCLELPTLDWTLRLELVVLVLAPSARRIPVICKSRRHPSSQTSAPGRDLPLPQAASRVGV